jgi:hypothetical protein
MLACVPGIHFCIQSGVSTKFASSCFVRTRCAFVILSVFTAMLPACPHSRCMRVSSRQSLQPALVSDMVGVWCNA